MKSLIVLSFVLFACILYSQTFFMPWQKTIGGDNVDALSLVFKTSEGGYLLAGFSNSGFSGDKSSPNYSAGTCSSFISESDKDYWIVKLKPNKTVDWDKTIGGACFDDLRCAIEISEQGYQRYLIGGASYSNSSGDKLENTIGSYGYGDFWIVKLDEFGNILCQNTIGGEDNDICTQVLQTSDGGYLIAGVSRSDSSYTNDKSAPYYGDYDYWVLKMNSSCDIIEWQKSYGGSGLDFLNSVVQTSDGGYLLGGHSTSVQFSGNITATKFGKADYWVIKISSTGDIMWNKSYGGNEDDFLRKITKTNNGYLLSGTSNSNANPSGDKTQDTHGEHDYWVIEIDESGNYNWDINFGGTSSENLFGTIQTLDGGFLLAGESSSDVGTGNKTEPHFGQKKDIWLVKLTSSHSEEWQKKIGGTLCKSSAKCLPNIA